MGHRIDELEKSLNDLMQQAGVDESEMGDHSAVAAASAAAAGASSSAPLPPASRG